MATLCNNSTGNFTTAATWSLVDATSLSDSEAASTAVTTTFLSSAAFTPGVIVIDGIGFKILQNTAAAIGTVTARLAIAGVAVVGSTVTINASDLPAGGTTSIGGWVFFKFAAPITLLAATAYTAQIACSTTGTVTCYRSSTASDWSRFLRTTTTQAPAASDVLYVCGEYTGAGTSNSLTVTMNNTATTAWGKIEVSPKGTLSYGVAASTAYYLKLTGDLFVNGGGRFTMGTSGSPIPSTSSASLEFNVGSNVQYGLFTRGTYSVETFGATVTDRALLNADASAAATSLTSDVSTGWKSGDLIALASTTRTASESESKSLSGDATGTTIPIAAITNAHLTGAELINLTRNVKIFGQSITLQSYVFMAPLGASSLNYTEFYFLGSATGNKRGVEIGVTTGSSTVNRCSFRSGEVTSSIGVNITTLAVGVTVQNCVFYRHIGGNVVNASTAGANTITGCIAMSNISGATTSCFAFTAAISGTISNCTAVSGSQYGFNIVATVSGALTVSDLVGHSCSTAGIFINITSTSSTPIDVGTLTAYKNNNYGVYVSQSESITISSVVSYGNLNFGLLLDLTSDSVIKSANIYSIASFSQASGVVFQGQCNDLYIDSATVGTSGTHTTGDIGFNAINTYHTAYFRNCLFSSSTEISGQSTNLGVNALIGSAKHDQTVGVHKTWKRFGTITSDTTFFQVQAPSQRLTPNTASMKLRTTEKRFAVPSGKTARISVAVRKSVAGDGTAYNGNQARLILKLDPSAGISSDTVLATSTAASDGAFEILTATTVAATDDVAYRILVDCDGTLGWVNVDYWRVDII